MKRVIVASIALLLLCAGAREAAAQSSRGGDVGLGIVVGDPTGFSAQFRLDGRSALDLAVGLDLIDEGDFYAHLEYLFFLGDLSRGGTVGVVPYLGVGGFTVPDFEVVGVRAPFGLALEFNSAPVQIFAELALFMSLTPDVDGDVGGALGFRYFF